MNESDILQKQSICIHKLNENLLNLHEITTNINEELKEQNEILKEKEIKMENTNKGIEDNSNEIGKIIKKNKCIIL